jgi:8-oxo-dGTP pyrophosphatase MutT (NUDIX family)
LIRRSQDGFTHSGQIALPGGHQEAGESPEETALREAEEEIGLSGDRIRILGLLTPLPIPVSRHLVQPVLGFLENVPKLTPDPREVDHIFSVAVADLIRAAIRIEVRREGDRRQDIPYFHLEQHQIWGATAMILNEFRRLAANS